VADEIGPWNSTIKCKEAGMLSILHILGFCKKKVQGVDRVAGIVYDGGFQLVHE